MRKSSVIVLNLVFSPLLTHPYLCAIKSQQRDIAFQRCLFVRLGLLTKKRHCFSAMSLCSLGITHKKRDIAFQRCLFCSLGAAHKKETLLFSDVSLFVWDYSQKKDIAFQRCLFCSFRSAHKKKTLLFSDVSFGCPMGLEPMTFRTTI